jgi:hypothetical protein
MHLMRLEYLGVADKFERRFVRDWRRIATNRLEKPGKSRDNWFGRIFNSGRRAIMMSSIILFGLGFYCLVSLFAFGCVLALVSIFSLNVDSTEQSS